MKSNFRTVCAPSMPLVIGAHRAGCDSGANERAVFAQNMTASAGGLTALTSGTENEILVIQLLRATPAGSEVFFQDRRLPLLRSKGFKRVVVRDGDGKTLSEEDVN
jgi:hypothetical protein